MKTGYAIAAVIAALSLTPLAAASGQERDTVTQRGDTIPARTKAKRDTTPPPTTGPTTPTRPGTTPSPSSMPGGTTPNIPPGTPPTAGLDEEQLGD